MCNCNSSFCAVCCRRVKAYRFDNVPEITGDLQLYTEFYKVGEAYGHWKFTVDDLIDYLPFGYGTVTSVDASISGALSVTGGPITTAGTLAFTWNGSIGQYVRGDGTLATFPTIVTYTAGTGIDITGGVITNTLPSLWQRTSTVLSPLTANDTVKIGTTNTGIQTLLTLENTSADVNRAVRIDLGAGGIIQSYPDAANSFIQFLGGTNGVRFGTISYGSIFYAIDTGSYALLYTNQYSDTRLAVHRGTADTALHVGGEVKIDTINNYASATQILVNNGNVISYATKADLGIPTVTPSAISKIDDTNVTLTLGGGYATALLQATSLTIGWTGNLSVSRGGSGAGTFTAGYLKANGTTAFTTVATIPYTDISGTPTIPTQYWQRSAAVLSPLNLYDSLYLSGATGSVNTLLQLDYLSSSASNGARIDFTLSGSTVNGYVSNEVNGTLFFTNVYGIDGVSLQTKTGGVTSDVLIARANKTVYINTIPNFAGGTDFLVNNSGTISYRTISSFGTVTSIASGNGMNFSTITSTGTITMGMPSSISLVSTNSTSTTSHTHAFVPGGTSSQVILGNGGFGSYIPGLWQRSGSEIRPLNANDTVRITTTSTGVQTLLTLANTSADVNRAVRIDLGAGGIIQSYPDAANSFIQFLGGTNGVRFGTIAGGTFMSLTDNGSYVLLNTSQFVDTRLAVHRGTADEALHVGGKVKIDTISTVSSSTNLLTTNGGVLETRTIASLTGLTTDVFKIQGGTTNASAITDDIYHNGKLKLGTSTSSAYMLSVSGTGYFTSTVDFNNNVGIQGFTTGAVIKNLIKMNSSNIVEIGVSGNDITLPSYLNSRNDSSVTPANYLFTSSAGLLLSRPGSEVINNFASLGYNSTGQTITANSTYTNITTATYNGGSSFSPYTYSSNNLVLTAGWHQLQAIIEYVMDAGGTGTPEVFAQFTVNGGAVSNSEGKMQFLGTCWRLPILIHSTASAGQILRVQIKVTTGTGNIKVTRCNIFANPTA